MRLTNYLRPEYIFTEYHWRYFQNDFEHGNLPAAIQ